MKMFLSVLSIISSHAFANVLDHTIVKVTGDTFIELEDGSVWEVRAQDTIFIDKALKASLSFRADESWLSSDVKCHFVNKQNNDVINVTLVSPPDSYIKNSHWVAYLEPKKSILFLDNGAIFSLYDNDREYFKNWQSDDFVLTGDYKGWFGQAKHILFNYRTKEFIFGELH